MPQTAPFHRLTLAAAAVMALAGCDAIYDDTKGWANRLEARVLEKTHEWTEEEPELAPAGNLGEVPPAVPVEPVETAEMMAPPPQATITQPPALPVNGDPGVMAGPAMTAKPSAMPMNGDPGVMAGPAMAAKPSAMPMNGDPGALAGTTLAAAPAPEAAKEPSGKDAKALPPHPQPKPKPPATQQAKTEAPGEHAAPAPDHAVVLHLSSLRSETAAQREWSDLQHSYPAPLAEMPVEFRRTELGDKGTFYRVLAGPLPSPEKAREVCAQLKAKDAKQYCRILPAAKPKAS